MERTKDEFEDVGADTLMIQDGCLVFFPDEGPIGQPNYILAAGQWISVCEAAE